MAQEQALVTEAYVCEKQDAPLKLQKITLPALKATEIELDMVCCGLCHTDCHMTTNDWGVADYPLVPGHEGVGVVRAVGSSVKTHQIGDKVAIAWIRDSCLGCDACLCGRENICRTGYQGTYLGKSAGPWGSTPYNEHGGCFSKVMRIAARFAVKIPEAIPDEIAAPLACGGGTVFEPIVNYCQPGSQLGIVGIGGLGTVAIKLAKLRGVTVTAISSSPHKKKAALAAGAKNFIVVSNEDDLKTFAGKLDVIMDTTPVNADIAKYMDLLKFDGVYCRVGIPLATDHKFEYNFIPLIFTQKQIVGSIVTGTSYLTKMFDLVADNLDFVLADNPDMKQVDKVKFSEVNECMSKLVKRENKGFRYVLYW